MPCGRAVKRLYLIKQQSGYLNRISSEQTQTESFPVRLEIGEENHIIQSKPRRLAVLSADLIQALEDIGAASLVCAVSNDAPANISVSGAKACGTVLDPDLSQIAASKPDWVLVSSPMRQSQKEALSQQGIEVITFTHPDSIDQIKERYRQLFTLSLWTGRHHPRRTVPLPTMTKNSTTPLALRWNTPGFPVRKRLSTLHSLITPWQPAKLRRQMLDSMGLKNIGDLGSRWNYPEIEKDELTPDILFYDSTIDPEQIKQSEVYKDCPAVTSDQLVAVDFSAMRLRGLPMIEELAKMLAPHIRRHTENKVLGAFPPGLFSFLGRILKERQSKCCLFYKVSLTFPIKEGVERRPFFPFSLLPFLLFCFISFFHCCGLDAARLFTGC